MAKHAVIRTDLMTGTTDGAFLRSLRYMGTGSAEAEIDNGNIVKLDSLMDGSREVWKAVTPAKDTPVADLAIVATPEVLYDERKRNLSEFVNEAGTNARGYLLHTNNIFSVTAEALDAAADIAVGDIVELQADSTKMKVVKTATSATTTIGKVISIENTGRYTYYAIKIA